MEEGSLLHEALVSQGGGGQQPQLENALLLDVYLLQQHSWDDTDYSYAQQQQQQQQHLIALADLAVQLNAFFQSQNSGASYYYPWMSGGDGPVFGIHCSDATVDSSSSRHVATSNTRRRSVPHLRSVCRYGVSVADEWKAIGLVMEFCRHHHHYDMLLAVECWDIDDGQVLLIQAAEHLPDWVDRIGPERCRHRCWIQGGRVQLIRPNDDDNDETDDILSLGSALDLLQSNRPLVTAAPDAVQLVIQCTIDRIDANNNYHKAAVVVPRSVARLLSRRPDLVSTSCRFFVDQTALHNKEKPLDEWLVGTCEDWVWTTVRLGRTAYAMLRTIAAAPDWKTPNAMPAPLAASLEVKRLKRQCAVEATPHLKHGLQLGIRLVAGLDHILSMPRPPQSEPSSPAMSLVERHLLLHWSRIARQCCGDDEWIAQAWQAGPNNAKHNLESILKCPVFDDEVEGCLTPLSHSETDLYEQIRKELLLRDCSSDDDFGSIPHPGEVDDEEWMWMPARDEDLLPRHDNIRPLATNRPEESSSQSPTTAALDEILEGVQSFMAGRSTVDGVATTRNEEVTGPMQINPTVFLNILHTALQAKSAEELVSRLRAARTSVNEDDPFFSQEDYDLMEPDDTDSDGDDDRVEPDDINMVDLMNAMDEELRAASSGSRVLDIDESVDDPMVAQDAHILSNLLKSLDAGAGAPGPIKNMLNEMGMKAPDLPSDD